MGLSDAIKNYFGEKGQKERAERRKKFREEELERLKYEAEKKALEKKIREAEK